MKTALLLMTSLLVACSGELPSPTLVQDLRVLAVRAEPPEIWFDRQDGWVPEATRFEALVVDPRRGEVPYLWQLCPVESDQACADYDRWRDRARPELAPTLDSLRALRHEGAARVSNDGAPLAQVDPFEVKLESPLFMHHLVESGLGLGNGVWPSAVLTIGQGIDRLDAQKRVTVNARDLSQWNAELAARFGMSVCTETASPAGCLSLPPRTPNRNPGVAKVLLAQDEDGTTGFGDAEGATIAAGAKVRLRPVLSEGAEESYHEVDADLQTGRLQVAQRREEAIVSWFTTDGELRDEKSARQLTKDLDNVFTAPTVPPPGGVVHLWLVVRDQRGGTGWTRLDLRVTP